MVKLSQIDIDTVRAAISPMNALIAASWVKRRQSAFKSETALSDWDFEVQALNGPMHCENPYAGYAVIARAKNAPRAHTSQVCKFTFNSIADELRCNAKAIVLAAELNVLAGNVKAGA